MCDSKIMCASKKLKIVLIKCREGAQQITWGVSVSRKPYSVVTSFWSAIVCSPAIGVFFRFWFTIQLFGFWKQILSIFIFGRRGLINATTSHSMIREGRCVPAFTPRRHWPESNQIPTALIKGSNFRDFGKKKKSTIKPLERILSQRPLPPQVVLFRIALPGSLTCCLRRTADNQIHRVALLTHQKEDWWQFSHHFNGPPSMQNLFCRSRGSLCVRGFVSRRPMSKVTVAFWYFLSFVSGVICCWSPKLLPLLTDYNSLSKRPLSVTCVNKKLGWLETVHSLTHNASRTGYLPANAN